MVPKQMKIHPRYFHLPHWICDDQHSKYVKVNSVTRLYLIFSKVNGQFEEINKNKYLMLVDTNESQKLIAKYEELWSKIRDLIRSITKNLDDQNEKYIKI